MVSSSVFLLKDVVFTFVALKLHIPQVISGRVTKSDWERSLCSATGDSQHQLKRQHLLQIFYTVESFYPPTTHNLIDGCSQRHQHDHRLLASRRIGSWDRDRNAQQAKKLKIYFWRISSTKCSALVVEWHYHSPSLMLSVCIQWWCLNRRMKRSTSYFLELNINNNEVFCNILKIANPLQLILFRSSWRVVKSHSV